MEKKKKKKQEKKKKKREKNALVFENTIPGTAGDLLLRGIFAKRRVPDGGGVAAHQPRLRWPCATTSDAAYTCRTRKIIKPGRCAHTICCCCARGILSDGGFDCLACLRKCFVEATGGSKTTFFFCPSTYPLKRFATRSIVVILL